MALRFPLSDAAAGLLINPKSMASLSMRRWQTSPTDSGASDELVIELALKANRVLLTEDKDFGDLVYNRSLPSPGVILIRRFPRSSARAKSDAMVEAAKSLGDTFGDRFVVVEPGRVRVGGRPRG